MHGVDKTADRVCYHTVVCGTIAMEDKFHACFSRQKGQVEGQILRSSRDKLLFAFN